MAIHVLGEVSFFFLFSSHSRCEIKRAGGEKTQFRMNFKVPGTNLSCTPFVYSFSIYFSSLRLSEIIRPGGWEILQKHKPPNGSVLGVVAMTMLVATAMMANVVMVVTAIVVEGWLLTR